MLRPNARNHQQQQQQSSGGGGGYGGGYGGYYGNGDPGLSYGGGGSSSSNGYNGSHTSPGYAASPSNHAVFKDKPRRNRRGSFVLPQFVQKLGLVGGVAVGVCTIMMLYMYSSLRSVRNQQARFIKSFGMSESFDDISASYRLLQRENSKLHKQVDEYHLDHSEVSSKHDELQEDHTKLMLQVEKLGQENVRLQEEAKQSSADAKAASLTPEQEQQYVDALYEIQNATQRASKRLVLERFGPGPHRVEFTVDLYMDGETVHTFVVEMAPLNLMPHAVSLFLQQVDSKLWDNGWFYINGPHVLQGGPQVDEDELDRLEEAGEYYDERKIAIQPFVDASLDSVTFPEYSPEFPHEQWTLGMTGRPGGPDWYINKINNTLGHGPSGQDHHDDVLPTYGDPCFAKVVDGFETLKQIYKEPTAADGDYRYFFEEPIHIIRGRIISEAKPKADEAKAEGTPQEKAEANVDGAASASDTGKADGSSSQKLEKSQKTSKYAEGEWRAKRGEREVEGEKKSNRRRLMMAMFDHQVEP